MKRFLIPMLSLALFGAACNDDNDEGGGKNLPSVEVGEVSFSEEDEVALVEVKPSENTEIWYWKYGKAGEEPAYESKAGNEITTLEMTVELDTDYTLWVYAENEDGKSTEVTRNFNISSAELTGDLVSFEIKNLTAFSVDVEVKKSIKCSKYVVGAMFTDSYQESYFIESAKTSLNPNPDYPIQSFNWSDKDETFTEYTLVKATLQDSDENKGLSFPYDGETTPKYTVAVYALPSNGGEAEVFTKEFEVPKPSNYNGSVEVEIDIADEDITLSSVAATISADANCKKIFSALVGAALYKPFEEMTDEEKVAFLGELGNGATVRPYTEPFKRDFETELVPGAAYRIYAVPIDGNGVIGKVTCKDFTTKKPEFKGTGEITAARFWQDTPDALKLSLTVSGNVEKVRVLSSSDYEYSTLIQSISSLEWIMYDDQYSYWRTDYTKDQLAELSLTIAHPGEAYRVYAVTISADGTLSYPVNLIALSEGSEDMDKTIITEPEEEVEIEVKFDGTGEAALKITETDKVEEEWNPGQPAELVSLSAECSVTKGANTTKVYCFRTSDTATEDTIEEELKEAFANYPESVTGAYTEMTFANGDTESAKFENLVPYSDSWGGHIIVAVTVDTDGKLKIADKYLAGSGDRQ
ncbi:MAG: hypothetical protein LUF83_07355 [Alistipes sp.]|nr:hypothetical protein [Alistipes sp.]